MSAPTHTISVKSGDSFQPSWVVSFVRFADPISSRASRENGSDYWYMKTSKRMILENDCTSVSINNAKGSVTKTCNLTLKAGEVFYPNAVKPGDWVMVWMVNNEEDKDTIVKILNKKEIKNKTPLNRYDLGMKFIGRVTDVSSVDSIDSSYGSRTVSQSVTASAFVELTSSIYFTYIAKSYLNPQGKTNVSQPVQAAAFTQQSLVAAVTAPIGEDWLNFFSRAGGEEGTGPGEILELVLAIGLGIDSSKAVANSSTETNNKARGSFHDGIGLPKDVSNILGYDRSPNKVWEMYNIYTGIQEYANQDGTLGQKFTPKLIESTKNNLFKKCKSSVRGKITYIPPVWDNKMIWDFAKQYSNPVVNELFTSLRVGPDNRIWPTITLRERPFGTGLYNQLSTTNDPTSQKKISDADKKPRGMYATHPRWIIDDSVIMDINVGQSDSNRVNMVQVWGNTIGSGNSEKDSMSAILANQFALGNYVIDENDISRHGLRADIQSTDMDLSPDITVLLAPKLARVRADHLFNGHMKWAGSVSLFGVQDPICEGDNIEVRGVVYHIDSVSHRCHALPTGQKIFRTSISMSNGILASSLTSGTKVPRYPGEQSSFTSNLEDQVGVTDIQFTGQRNRDKETGLAIVKPKKKNISDKINKGSK